MKGGEPAGVHAPCPVPDWTRTARGVSPGLICPRRRSGYGRALQNCYRVTGHIAPVVAWRRTSVAGRGTEAHRNAPLRALLKR
eukprot:CAMPEP_0115144680 /NCGR_PEP_ID=MMETSP0227-20121206/61664_1 /TAXON_ID=89957 /ORGANISM="Polarella glacialis, Strain CCMP 1383" /LENGTH=82 /DNA_ID=CAMNT_0002554053 /DNA_START=120 /DNA_END=368 /DNA_ORIENTATION=-